MPVKQTARSIRAAGALSANLMLAPAVIAMCMPLLEAEASGSNPYRVETVRAISEKMSAWTEGVLAAQMAWMQATMQFWPQVWSGQTPSLFSGATANAVLSAALVPSGRTVKSNHRRLSRKR